MTEERSIKRCAVYTRKSTEEGLEMDFNSLQAQRESCEAFIKSQRGEGWTLISNAYDDGGISGGTMQRPALQRLLADIESKAVDVVVVYKVDRLTRSLHDFSKMVEVFDRQGVSFVAVTQQFNTTSSMGRLTLNVLLSFAQFEREVTGERIRDKVAASKKKGIWMGGGLPRGYRVEDRKLIVVPEDAEVVRTIFSDYLECSSVRELAISLKQKGIASRPHGKPSNDPMSRGALHTILRNPIYIGVIPHKKERYQGQHTAIIDKEIWKAAQEKLETSKTCRGKPHRKTEESPLMGKIFDESNRMLTPIHSSKRGRRYRYYVTHEDHRDQDQTNQSSKQPWRLPALEIERRVDDIIQAAINDQAAVGNAAINSGMDTHGVRDLRNQIELAGMRDRLKWVERVQLKTNRIEISINLPTTGLLKIERAADMSLKRRGIERRIILEGMTTARAQMADPQIFKALSLGLRFWDQMLSENPMTSLEFSKTEEVDNSNVGRALPLAFLAPHIVADLLAGKQLADVTAKKMLRIEELPLNWRDQSMIFCR